jgi:hypothetical protein
MRRRIFDVLSPQIKKVAVEYHQHLVDSDAPHALIGGIAVGAYTEEPRATRDIDFLVSGNAFGGLPSSLGKLDTVRYRVSGVPVDLIFVDKKHAFLEEAIGLAKKVEKVPVLPAEALVYLKLIAHRRRDQDDIRRMIASGHLDVRATERYLEKHAPQLVKAFLGHLEAVDRGEE